MPFPLLNHTEWDMISEKVPQDWYDWKRRLTEKKWTLVGRIASNRIGPGALGSTAITQCTESGALNSNAINRVKPEVAPKARPPPPPETGSSGNVEERPTSANQAEYSTEPGAGRTNASNGNPNVGRQR